MPRKKGDDDELRRRTLGLRRKGLSYVEIGRQLGRSSYKAWELISPYESHQPKITQVAELDQKIGELNSMIVELRKATYNISAELKKVTTIKELSSATSRHDVELKDVKGIIEIIDWSAQNRISDREFGCKWIDRDDFCNKWTFPKRGEWKMRQKEREGEIFYQLNVKEQPLVCVACPQFEKRGISLTKT